MFVGLFTFSLLYLTLGDPAAIMGGQDATPEDIIRLREKLGLNEPFHIRLGKWVGTVLRGDLGDSILLHEIKVTDLILDRVEPTLSLAILSFLIAVIPAIPMVY